MSWIGSGLSQITGQISNFTKEVLTEGTEEVDDHVTALQLTRSRLAEQEAHSSAYRSEVDKLKHINDDLTEKLQSAELQSNAISKEYRAQLDEREEEIKKLKQKQNEMLDFQGKMAAASSSQPTLSHSASVPLLTAFGSDEHDFDDVISSQHEINRLRSEVQRLLAESHHWRQVAASSQAQAQNAGTDIAVGQEESSAALQARIKEIQQEVSDEIDQHQRELATLQDVHTQKMATIKKKHKDEIRQYQDQVQELQEELQAGSRQNEGSDLTDSRSQQMDQENAKLKTALQEAEKRTQQLQEKTTVLEQEKLKLKSEIDAANERLKQQETEIQNLKRSTNLDNDLANSDGSVVDTSLEHALREATLPSSTPLRSPRPDSVTQGSEVDSRCLTSDFSDSTLSVRNKELDDQVRTLLKQIEAYEQEIEHFEFVKSDWLMEKEALEDVLLKLRQELSQKEEMLSVIQAKKGLAEIQQQEGKKRKKKKVPTATLR